MVLFKIYIRYKNNIDIRMYRHTYVYTYACTCVGMHVYLKGKVQLENTIDYLEFGRADAEAETSIFWPPDVKS